MFYVLALLAVSTSALLPEIRQKLKKNDHKKIVDRISPYYHLIGLIGFIVGIITVVQAVFNLGVIRYASYGWMLWTASGAIMMILGFLAGFPQIILHIAKEGHKKANNVFQKFAPYEKILAMVGVVVAVMLLMHLISDKNNVFYFITISKLPG